MSGNLHIPTAVKSDEHQGNNEYRQYNVGNEDEIINSGKFSQVFFRPSLKPVVNHIGHQEK